jgi:hypothetical protein
MVFDGIGDGLWQGNGKVKITGTTRGQEGGTRRGNETTNRHNERMREWRNKRMKRDNAITSWHNKTTRGRHDDTTR